MRSSLIAGAAACALLLGAAATPAQAESPVIAAPSAAEGTLPISVNTAWPGVVVIARLQLGGRRMSDGWWRTNGYRPVTVYYVDGRYYNRWSDRYRGHDVRRVVVYQRGGRFYRDWDDDNRGYGRNDRDHGRYDDHYGRNDRRDDRNHGRADNRDRGRDRH